MRGDTIHSRCGSLGAAPIRVACLLVALVWPGAAAAQMSRLDKTTLIDALTEEGMSELLLRLIEVEPADDPVVQAQLEIAQHRLRYSDPALPRADQLAAFEAALDRLRKLIADLPDHPQRPIWQTELAEMLLVDKLTVIHQNAPAFYEFGVPSPEQVEAFGDASVEALRAASSANLRFFQLQTLLPREPDHVDKRVNTGLWKRMIDDYYLKRTPFFLAQASHQVSLLPKDHPYFHTDVDTAAIPDKLADPAAEKRRLALHARQLVQPFADDASDPWGVRMTCLTLMGRSLLTTNEPDEAVLRFQPVVAAAAGDLPDLLANLGLARAAELKGQFPTALDRLAALDDHPLVAGNLLYRVLVTDARHRVLLAQAESAPENRREAALAIAYDPYLMLLDDPALGEQSASLKHFIFQRWAATVPDDRDPAALPPMVRMAVGEVERITGQNLAVEAEQTGDADIRRRALEHLQRSIRFSEAAADPDAPDAVRAQAMFNLGMARYLTNPQELGAILSATSAFVTLADELPEQPQAEQAIGYAVALLRALHQLEPRPAGVDQAYRHATDVLFERYPRSAAADNERLYYGYYILVQGGRYRQAVDMLLQAPESHSDYFAAQREALFALEQAMREASSTQEQADLRAELRQLAEQARQRVAGGDDPAERNLMAAVRLVLASAAASEGDTDAAITHLTGFEDEFADQPDLVRMALGRRIAALAQAGRMAQLEASAQRMMRDFPDGAAAVIDQVLTTIDQRIDKLRTEAAAAAGSIRPRELEEQASRLASTALTLSDLLVRWARGRGYDAEQMLPFELIQAKTLRLVGEDQQAAQITERLHSAFPNDADVLTSHAESLFQLGDPESLIKAAGLYDKLIRGMTAPYPPLWWNAWMRRLQINDRVGQGTADIPLRVRQLKLTDPDLGGPRFRETLEALARKHQ